VDKWTVREFISNASREAADYLMNGVSGLRATYASDHVVGSRVNSAVCQVIADAILDSRIKISRGTPNSVRETLRECVATSMSKLSAKVWYDSDTDKSSPDIQLGTVSCSVWEANWIQFRGLAERLGLTDQQLQVSISKGKTVPRPRKLDVKGAFVYSDEQEYVALSKRTRPLQIHLVGWT
jgi:hypothetical protein